MKRLFNKTIFAPMGKPTCFISYCHEGADSDSIEYLIQQLREESGNKIDFLYDAELRPGSRVVAFMDLVKKSDGIIILLTPSYKQRIESREGGVYKEFSEIIKRYQDEEEQANANTANACTFDNIDPPFCLMPLIFSGSFQQSCPSELSENLCISFSTYRAHRTNGELHITEQTKRNYSKRVGQLVSNIFTYHSSRKDNIARAFDEKLQQFLVTTKHEHLRSNPEYEAALIKVFVKTYAFKKVKRQTSYLLVGRKGSGKSAIVHYLASDVVDMYNEVIDINVNKFELEYLYSIIGSPQVRSELGTVINQVVVFEVVWEVFLYICCINIVRLENDNGRLKASQKIYCPRLSKFLDETFPGEINYRAAFRWAYAKIITQLSIAIQNARNEPAAFNYDISNFLESDKILESVIGEECIGAFHNILRQCKRRFLVSFDGFDTAFEQFRMHTQSAIEDANEKRRRTEYEIDWLRGFVHVVIDIKSSPKKNPLANLLDFSATVPKDRFIEIRDNERDSYIYIGKSHEIRWSAIELVILLYKRLEEVENYKTDRNKSPHIRLEEILSKKYGYIPPQTEIEVGETLIRLPIFIDVLRHTFWRPREILIYFAKIITVLTDFKKRNIEAKRFSVSKCISDTSREIIKTEFFNEFQRHCPNLKAIIERFRGKSQILNRFEIEDILQGEGFEFVGKAGLEVTFDRQIRFLYEIGFIGLDANKRVVERLKLLHRDIFCFNAGDEPFDLMLSEGFSECSFVIHPIFSSFLDLNVNANRLVLEFDWDYLQQQEIYIVALS